MSAHGFEELVSSKLRASFQHKMVPYYEVTRMSRDFEAERDKMAVLWQNRCVVIIEVVYGGDQN